MRMATSYISPWRMVSEVSARKRMGESAGFVLRQNGFCGSATGNWLRAAFMAAWTSRAAASILRLKSNCKLILVDPSELEDVISLTPAIWPSWRSSGVATDDAMVSGLAPGKAELTLMAG